MKKPYKATSSYWETNLFSEVFLKKDLAEHFQDWNSVNVDNSFKNVIKYIESSVDLNNFQARNEDDTLDIIIELLEILEWHNGGHEKRDLILKNTCFLEELESEDGGTKKKLYKPDVILLDKPGQRRSVNPSLKEYDREAAEKFCLAPLEAKYWGRLKATDSNGKLRIDKNREVDRDKLSLQPNQQIQKYMDILGKEWGILTDGATWRLFNALDSNGEDIFYEFKLDMWLQDVIQFLAIKSSPKAEEIRLKEAFKYFYFFFRKDSFLKSQKQMNFLQKVQMNTRKYVRNLELDLSDRFLAAISSACNGYLEVFPNRDDAIRAKRLIQDTCESLLFNILFIRSCETVGVLKTQVAPYSKHAIEPIIESIGVLRPEHGTDNLTELTESFQNFFDENYEYKATETDLYEYLLQTFEISKSGMGSYFKGFRESLFSKSELEFAKKHKLKNECVVKILFILSYDISKTYRDEFGTTHFQQIAFNTLKPRQLGSIYESFLDFELAIDPENNRQLKKSHWVKTSTNQSDISLSALMKQEFAPKNTFYFARSEKSERKATGSYYTPDFVVDYIVSEAIDPQINFSNPESVLEMSVCDPAMGSGHFLASAMRQLASHYEQIFIKKNNQGLELSRRDVMTMVLEKCIFGVDLNSRAIKLAKMALWLETATPGMHLVNLDKSLLEGNALYASFDWDSKFKRVFDKGGFSSVVANPPYLGEKYNQAIFEEIRNNPKFLGLHERRSNTYYYFTMLTSKIMKPDGIAGQIIPIEWESNGSARKMRDYLSQNTKTLAKLRFQKLKVFKSKGTFAGTSSMILLFRNWATQEGVERIPANFAKVVLSGPKLQKLISDESFASNQLKIVSSANVIRNSSAARKRFINSTGITANNIKVEIENDKKREIKISKGGNEGDSSTMPLHKVFHVDQGIVTGADLVTKKNKFIGDNWRKFEDQKNLGILILKLNTDIVFKGKSVFLNAGTAESKYWEKLNESEIKVVKPLYKNKDIGSFGQITKPSSYVIFFKDEGRKIDLSAMPTIKKHLERYKDVLVASKENCYHNEMLKKIMEPIVDRGNYFVTFYPRPKTDFEGEKIVFVCDQVGKSFTYSNAAFYASGGNKGGLSFITKLTDEGPTLKLLYSLLVSRQYADYLGTKDIEAFLSNDFIKKLPIDTICAHEKDEYLTLIEGTYSTTPKKDCKFDTFSKTYISSFGLIDLYMRCCSENRLAPMRFKSQEEADKYFLKNENGLIRRIQADMISLSAEDLKKLINTCFKLSKSAQTKIKAASSK